MADGLYAVEFGRAEAGNCNTYFPGTILLLLKSGDPERVRFSLAGRKYWGVHCAVLLPLRTPIKAGCQPDNCAIELL